MSKYEYDAAFESKMNQITQHLEELILYALLKTIKKIKAKNYMLEELLERVQNQSQ